MVGKQDIGRLAGAVELSLIVGQVHFEEKIPGELVDFVAVVVLGAGFVAGQNSFRLTLRYLSLVAVLEIPALEK